MNTYVSWFPSLKALGFPSEVIVEQFHLIDTTEGILMERPVNIFITGPMAELQNWGWGQDPI